MVRPERRTRADIAAAAAIALVVAVAAGLIWWTSNARATDSRPAATPVPTTTEARAVPGAFEQLWTAVSPKSTAPVVAGGTVVTGDGRDVQGRDPITGNPLWSYSRDLDLCGVTSVYRYAVAVYPDDRGCGQVSTIDASTGRRGPSRTAYADGQVSLSTDGSTVLSAGRTRVELWRSDVVRMLSYGAIDARIKPSTQDLAACSFVSAGASSSSVSLLEACPAQPELRLTLLKVADEEDTPELRYVPLPGVAADAPARVVAVSGLTTAVYLPTPQPKVVIIDETGNTVASTLLSKPASPDAVMSHAGDDLITWWTGDSVMVFNESGLTYKYTVSPGTAAPLGPAAVMADRMLIPVTGGVGVYDPANGTNERTIPVSRTPGQAPVVPGVVGETLVEQRGDTVVALGKR